MSELSNFFITPAFSDEDVEAAIEALDTVRAKWMRLPGVNAVDVGFKTKGRKTTPDLAIRVHVERKRKVPRDEQIPATLGGFPTDVIEATYEPQACSSKFVDPSQIDPKDFVGTLLGGVSLGGGRTTAGTLGAIVWDRSDGQVCLLSNWHVLAGSHHARAGEPIFQPGPYDGGGPSETVAVLKRSRLDTQMDAAIAELVPTRHYCPTFCDASATAVAGAMTPKLGVWVHKNGRTTGTTEAFVEGLSLSTTPMEFRGGVRQRFHDQLRLKSTDPKQAVSRGGDSGALWVDRGSNLAVGLHFAGEGGGTTQPTVALANRVDHVVDKLQVSFTPVLVRGCGGRCGVCGGSRSGSWLGGRPQPVHDPIDGRPFYLRSGRPQPVHDPIDGSLYGGLRSGRPQPVHDPIDGSPYAYGLRSGHPQPVHDPIDGCPVVYGPRSGRPQPVHDPIDGAPCRCGMRRSYY